MMGGYELKNKTSNVAIRPIIENGEVEEIKENTMDSKNWIEILTICPTMECSNLTTYPQSAVLFSMRAPKIQKEYL